VHVAADAVTDELADNRKAGLLDVLLDCRADIADAVAGLGLADPDGERFPGDLEQALGGG